MAELSRNPQEPGFVPSSPSPTTGAETAAPASAAGPDAEDGLPLEEFARKAGLAEAEVWKRLRRGELVGRTERGRLFVYATGAAAESAQATFGSWLEKAGTELPPLPGTNGATAAGGDKEGGFLSLAGERTGAPELALLLDHLSLAKEENREILRLTQESIRKVTELTDKIVVMKDQVIDAKEAQIMALQQQLAAKGEELRRTAQANEDLEMLARTMAERL